MYKLSIEAKGGFLTDDIQRVVDKQLPFIEKIQKRIREEYNWYHTWQHILENIE